ncbi:MAG: hypothetical protein ACYC4R_03435 [Anaerolineae bacterium]
MGAVMNKGLTIRTGQTHVLRYMRPLLEIMQRGEIDPSYIVSHHGALADGPAAYRAFSEREGGFTKSC